MKAPKNRAEESHVRERERVRAAIAMLKERFDRDAEPYRKRLYELTRKISALRSHDKKKKSP